jgi:ABC-type methionine transport system ATPase subunit
MAAIRIIELLHAHAEGALAIGNQNVVSLRELRLEQAIKRIGNVDLK